MYVYILCIYSPSIYTRTRPLTQSEMTNFTLQVRIIFTLLLNFNSPYLISVLLFKIAQSYCAHSAGQSCLKKQGLFPCYSTTCGQDHFFLTFSPTELLDNPQLSCLIIFSTRTTSKFYDCEMFDVHCALGFGSCLYHGVTASVLLLIGIYHCVPCPVLPVTFT